MCESNSEDMCELRKYLGSICIIVLLDICNVIMHVICIHIYIYIFAAFFVLQVSYTIHCTQMCQTRVLPMYGICIFVSKPLSFLMLLWMYIVYKHHINILNIHMFPTMHIHFYTPLFDARSEQIARANAGESRVQGRQTSFNFFITLGK